jgi:hypothetical protein
MSDLDEALSVGTKLGEAIAEIMEFGQAQGERVTRERLKESVMALRPDENGRISKGLVLAMIMGEVT